MWNIFWSGFNTGFSLFKRESKSSSASLNLDPYSTASSFCEPQQTNQEQHTFEDNVGLEEGNQLENNIIKSPDWDRFCFGSISLYGEFLFQVPFHYNYSALEHKIQKHIQLQKPKIWHQNFTVVKNIIDFLEGNQTEGLA